MMESALFKRMTLKQDQPSGLVVRIRWEKDGSVMALIPAGEFMMGSVESELAARCLLGTSSGEGPRHKVFLDAYYIDECEVTVAQYGKFSQATGQAMRAQPQGSGDSHPVVNVSWIEAAAYAAWAGKRLPTEAEWEKAARGGTQTHWCFGDGESGLGEHGWYKANAGGAAHPVGRKKANQYGLYDMHGNVVEWVADWHERDYYRTSPAKNPQGPGKGLDRVWRGGCWQFEGHDCRAGSRNCTPPGNWYAFGGFRCAATVRR
ncbi:MAG: formylglycine-generating enzyme family protein [Elusimicrobia bacterium]|nr:formylglycine-generating enzyme family protein [Elusimicrobiota bacterium]